MSAISGEGSKQVGQSSTQTPSPTEATQKKTKRAGEKYIGCGDPVCPPVIKEDNTCWESYD